MNTFERECQKMRRLLAMSLAVVLVLGIGGIVAAGNSDVIEEIGGWGQRQVADERGPVMKGPRHEEPPLLSRKLDLTDAQLATIERLREENLAQKEPPREERCAHHEQDRSARVEGNSDQAEALREEMHTKREEMFALREQNRAEIRNVLTPEQQEQLEEFQQEQCPMDRGDGLGRRGGERGFGGGRRGPW
jgi:Spy/CpxP family protein refolding chaperone